MMVEIESEKRPSPNPSHREGRLERGTGWRV